MKPLLSRRTESSCRQFLRHAVIMMWLAPLFTGACTERPATVTSPHVVGVEPISAVSVSGYSDVLSAWRLQGYLHATVIHIGPKDGLAFVPDEQLEAIRSSLAGQPSGGDARSRITGDNYLFIASRMGLVDRVFWISPYNLFNYINAEERVKSFLRDKASLFPQRDIESMHFGRGCVSGTLAGVETHVCGPAAPLPLTGPAPILIDAEFFPIYASERGISSLNALKEVFDLMALKKIRTTAVFLLASRGLSAMRGYLVDETAAVLKDPSITKRETPPPLWTVRDEADNMLNGGGIGDADQYLRKNIRAYADDPYLNLMQATAQAVLGKQTPALRTMVALCTEKQEFCRGIADAGVMLRDRGDLAGAETFFLKVLSLRPDLDSARFNYALTLYAAHEYLEAKDEALALSEKPSFTVESSLLLGDCAHAQGREPEAIGWYAKAVSAYRAAGGYRLSPREQDSLARLKSVYVKTKNPQGLRSLDGIPLPN